MSGFILPAPALLAGTLLASFLAGLARGFSGFGSALIFVPLASALLGPRLAVPLLMLIDNLSALPMVPAAWRNAARREVALLAAGAMVGTPLGVLALLRLDPVVVRWAMCLLALAMLALLVSGWRYRGRPVTPLSLAVGVVAGICGGLAQMSGPAVLAYWLGGAVPAHRIRSNIILFFAFTSVVGAATYLLSGLLTLEVVVLSLLAGPVFALGTWMGARLFGLASEATFRRICLILIGLAALLGLPLWQ
ncbi:sulfite exporter TauE/SafE family protein [Roseomonas sp. OT10]|uniref:sulfite exporter TauE/SafE family protein n=1 Tax=Roseomonas cutis TaxID=2897332 RepID=UPI001E409C37|nr:sulfite exporter TauE/SafE family protein [Roseomonas sp. OT10]UFN50554.1 sulfite exporter TauE/SafE family protein [Roseomonas sp. OT10]